MGALGIGSRPNIVNKIGYRYWLVACKVTNAASILYCVPRYTNWCTTALRIARVLLGFVVSSIVACAVFCASRVSSVISAHVYAGHLSCKTKLLMNVYNCMVEWATCTTARLAVLTLMPAFSLSMPAQMKS